jgi:hypothetical protein
LKGGGGEVCILALEGQAIVRIRSLSHLLGTVDRSFHSPGLIVCVGAPTFLGELAVRGGALGVPALVSSQALLLKLTGTARQCCSFARQHLVGAHAKPRQPFVVKDAIALDELRELSLHASSGGVHAGAFAAETGIGPCSVRGHIVWILLDTHALI